MLYRRRPEILEAVQWTGNNLAEIQELATDVIGPQNKVEVRHHVLMIKSGERGVQGWLPVPLNHYVLRRPGDADDLWPMDEEHFSRSYETLQ